MEQQNVVRGKSVEASGKTIEQAIENALQRLGKSRDEVDIEVLREPRSGFLGFGAQDAIVRVTELLTVEPVKESEAVVDEQAVVAEDEIPAVSEEDGEGLADTVPPSGEWTPDAILNLAHELLVELLTRMHVIADVQAYWSEAADENEDPTLMLDVVGDNLGIIIGRHGSTLRDIQYLLRLMVGHHVQGRVNLVVDVEGYKKRRAEKLRDLALRKAEQVARTGRPLFLKPMTPYERRIVHLALRDHPKVTTQSRGQEPNRRVGIFPR
nr:RNA-binding cell elongation regulator Jag/EloR [Ardenticatena sp.]